MTVKAPIQVPSPISGSPMTQACSLYGFGGKAALGVRGHQAIADQVGHARPRP